MNASVSFPLPANLGSMPCGIKGIAVHRYVLPQTLGNAELEEAAARILLPSVEAEGWTGVSARQLTEQMQADFNEHNARYELLDRYDQDFSEYQRTLWRYDFLNRVTFGNAHRFMEVPKEPEKPEPYDGACSLIFLDGGNSVAVALMDLVEQEFIQKNEATSTEEGCIYYPTPKLVEFIRDKQRAA